MIFCVITLGCKVNQYETQSLERILAERGHTLVKPGMKCDVCIVNTCAVTAESARKSRQAIRKVKKTSPDAIAAVCGCLSQLEPSAVARAGADIIGGSGDRYGFALEIERKVNSKFEIRKGENSEFGIPNSEYEDLPPGGGVGRTRAFLKIQDGCDNFCTYCIIPYARGSARSLPLERASEYAQQLDSQGYREIVVTGIEISSYGKDLRNISAPGDNEANSEYRHTTAIYDDKSNSEFRIPNSEFLHFQVPNFVSPRLNTHNPGLTDVIRVISDSAPHARVRLGSLDPGIVTDGFSCDLSGISNLCAHFHLSMQSGCDDTLQRMGRKYDTTTALDAISSLRRRFPDCAIAADLIIGFPGETDSEFERTLAFIKAAAFSSMHIFPFSPRPGTRAYDMPDQVANSVRRERAAAAASTAADMANAFRIKQVGKIVDVLFEQERDGYWLGHSGNYLNVAVKKGGARNAVRMVKITGVGDACLFGEIV